MQVDIMDLHDVLAAGASLPASLDNGFISHRKVGNDIELDKVAKEWGRLVVYPGGVHVVPNYTHVHSAADSGSARGGRRGQIYKFSKNSRRRLVKLLLRLDLSDFVMPSKKYGRGRGFFVTLTYGKEFPYDYQRFKRDLDNFRKRLDRFMGAQDVTFGAIWKLELQKRSAAHFHLLILTSRMMRKRDVISFVQSAWVPIAADAYDYSEQYIKSMRRVVSDGGVQVAYQSGDNPDGLRGYLSKYMSKEGEELISPDGEIMPMGRMWGVWHKDNLPIADIYVMAVPSRLDLDVLLAVTRGRGRRLDSYYLQQQRGHMPFYLYGDSLEILLEFHLAGCRFNPN